MLGSYYHMDESRLAILFKKYLSKTATPSERDEFFQLVTQPGADSLLRKYGDLYLHYVSESGWAQLEEDASERILAKIFSQANQELSGQETEGSVATQSDENLDAPLFNAVLDNTDAKLAHMEQANGRPQPNWRRYAAAAVVLLVAVGGLLFINRSDKPIDSHMAAANQVLEDAQPGHNGAILSLASGQSFLLDTMRNGQVALGIVKSAQALKIEGAGVERATLKTPLGRQQLLVLSDGTKVWLNAGSSIEFPTRFSENKRSVVITGEAYFEVVHSERQPFEVHAGDQVIRDLGTHFNVNAYDNEAAMKVTLKEGSVQIGDNVILKPGEEFSAGKVSKVNADGAIAWVSGYFHFERSDIQSVMRQLSRWYQVEVTYEGEIPSMKFGGDIQKSLQLSSVLELLSGTGIHYTLNGKQLIIRP